MKRSLSRIRLPIFQRLTAVAVGAVLGIVAFSFIWIIHETEDGIYKAALRERVVESASVLRARLEQGLNSRLLLVDGLAAYVKSGNALSPETFNALAKSMTFGHKDILALELAPNAVVSLVYPMAGNEKALSLDLRSLPGQSVAVERTIRDKSFVLAGPLDLIQGGRGLIGRKPIFISDGGKGETFWGFAIIIIDFDALIDNAGWQDDMDVIFALRGKDSTGAAGPVFLGPVDAFTGSPVLQDISLPGGSWQLASLPADGWNTGHPKARLHKIIAIIAFLLSTLGGYLFMRLYFYRAMTHNALLESENKYRQIVETTNAIYWELDLATWRFTYVSPHAVHLLGYPLEKWLQEDFWSRHLHPDDRDETLACCIGKAREGKDFDFEYRMLAADGSVVWLRNIVTVSSGAGGPYALTGTMIDITERKKSDNKIKASLAEKEVLLQEIHHRVKNNLQAVSSMLSLQANAEKDDNISAALLEGERRVRVMARVHENLYLSDDLASVNAKKYMEGIINDIKHNHQNMIDNISIQIDVDDVALGINQAIPIGQIGSELISNAFKHAFPDGRSGTVTISLKCDNDRFVFSVADDGVGMSGETDLSDNKRLGFQLINALARKLGGEVTVDRKNGTRVLIIFDGESS